MHINLKYSRHAGSGIKAINFFLVFSPQSSQETSLFLLPEIDFALHVVMLWKPLGYDLSCCSSCNCTLVAGMTRTSFSNRSLSSQSTDIAMYRILLMRSPLRSGLLALIYKHVPRASMEVALSYGGSCCKHRDKIHPSISTWETFLQVSSFDKHKCTFVLRVSIF